MADPFVASALIALVGSNVLSWIVEWRRGRNGGNGKNGGHGEHGERRFGYVELTGDLKEIKKTTAETNVSVGKIDKNLAVVTTEVGNMKANCHATTERFGKEINGNRLDIKDLMRKR